MVTDPIQPFAGAAGLYLAAGWSTVLPLPPRDKRRPPDGFTGPGGADTTPAEVAEWIRHRPGANVALRMPATVLGLDLDLYKDTGAASYAALVAECGPLPATWCSTSRADGSGIWLFTVPAGVRWAEGRAGPGIELVHRGHRYAVVWPSVHPEGRVYHWYTPDGTLSGRVPTPNEPPALPVAWGRHLSQPPAPPAPAPVTASTHPGGGRGRGYAAAALAGAVNELAGLRDGAGRNNALNRKAYALGGLVATGQLDPAAVRRALYEAAQANGHLAKHGDRQTLATIDSGLRAGMARPRRTA